LVTALVIHSLSIDYVSNRFTNHMNNYQTDQDSQNIINKIQTSYVCCGTDTWLDWSSVSLNATGNSTGTTTTATTTAGTASVGNTTTAAGQASNTTTTAGQASNTTTAAGQASNATTTRVGNTTTVSVGNTTTASVGNTTTQATGRAVRDIEALVDTAKSISDEKNTDLTLFNNGMKIANKNLLSSDIITNDLKFKRSLSQQTVRRRRQTQTNYGGIYGLPSSFSVTLPQSCCTTDGSSLANLSNSCQYIY
jgi:hypothetical protein